MQSSALRQHRPDGSPSDAARDDPAYDRRRRLVAEQAAGPTAEPNEIEYLPIEDDTWAQVHRALAEAWSLHAHPDLRSAWDRLALPDDHVPQLREVTERLRPLSGFRYRAVPGLVDKLDFFGGLADRTFLSTQYLRHPATPLYTAEPDVIHEVLGHANCLADPRIADLHQAAGAAIRRVERPASHQFIADVFWFSGEFGVIQPTGTSGETSPTQALAYGAGLLSSPGELAWYGSNADIRPLDIHAMGTLPYNIDHYQPVLFAGSSLDHVLDVVGGFFATATDDIIAAMPASDKGASE